MLRLIRSRSTPGIGRKEESGSEGQGEVVGDAVLFDLLWRAAPEARAAAGIATTRRASAMAGVAERAWVGVHPRTGGHILDDASNASASGRRNRVVLNDHIIAPGQWKDGKILLSRTAIREVATETRASVRRVLYDTAYHESFHGLVEPIAKLVSKWLGVDDIYEASQDEMLYGQGRGWWYRAEEGGAEFYGWLRGYLRDRWGWR
jgi:hypothetical protein